MSQNAVDFLPEDYVERRAQQRSAILFIGLFVAVMGGIVAAYWVGGKGPERARAERDQVNRQYEDAAKPLAEMQKVRQEHERMMAKAEVTATLVERIPRSRLLRELADLRPQGVNLLKLELSTKDVAAPRAPTRVEQAKSQQSDGDHPPAPPQMAHEVNLILTGAAPSDGQVATYIGALGKSAMLKDVNLLYSEEFKDQNNSTIRHFRVEMWLNPDADLTGDGNAADNKSAAAPGN